MDSLPSLPMATPYIWPDGEHDDDDEEEVCEPPAASTASRSPGFAFLQAQMLKSDGMSDAAKRTLMKMLQEQNVELRGPAKTAKAATSSPVTTVIDSTMDDETVLHLAANGQISFLGSILAIIDKHPLNSVSSKHIIKEVALTVNPSRTPGLLDAREMVLAALHFLSQTFTPSSDEDEDIVALPLIRPLSITGDLERRSYEKIVPWELDEIIQGVAALEERFYSSEADYPWLSREKFLPPSLRSAPDLDGFLLKGTLPEQLQKHLPTKGGKAGTKQTKKKAAPKAQAQQSSVRESSADDETLESSKPPSAKKRKTSSSPSSSLKLKATADPVRAEALRIYAATNNNADAETTSDEDDLLDHDDDNGDDINDNNNNDDVDDDETEDDDESD